MSLADKFGIPQSLFDAAKQALEEASEYQKKVQAHMAKKGIKSLSDMTDEQKKKFFNELDAMHKAKNEEVDLEEDIELTLEDIEYIMESEEFQQLDELSKSTLTSYVQKAKADRAAKQTKKNELEGARSMLNQLSAGAKGGGTQHVPGSFRATGPQYERPDVGINIKKHMPAMHKQLVKMHQKLQADRVETNRGIKKRDTGIAGAKDRMDRMNVKPYRNEEVNLDELQLVALETFMQTEDFEQLDELSKTTLGNYIKKRSHDVATMGAVTRKHAMDSEKARQDQNYSQQRKSMAMSDKAFVKGWKHRQNIAKAVDKLTKEDLEFIESLNKGEAHE